ncbi:MAG TPA: tetratricopeptide repeat protein [Tepidisphaeraceae bacterium]|jgi:superkiller protein 3
MSLPLPRLTVLLAATLAVSISGGCGSGKTKTQKEEAVEQWSRARAGVMHNLAQDQFETGNFDKAAATTADALKIDPPNVPLKILSARIAMEQNRLDLADSQLAEARKLDPKNSSALYLSGIVAQRWQKHDQALSFYEQAAEHQPTELAYLMARAETLVLLDRRAEALACLSEKVVYFEHSATLRDAVGQLLMQDHRYAEAADMFRQASILAGNDPFIRERLAMAYFQKGDHQRTIDVLALLVTQPSHDQRGGLFAVMGESQLQLDRVLDARVSFQRCTELDPSLPQGWLGLTKAALAMHDLQRAENAARKGVSVAPDRADAYLAYGYVRLRQNKLDDAMAAFRKASALDPSDSLSLCMIGEVLTRKGQPDAALTYYGQALKINPKDELASQLLVSAPLD